MTSTLTLVPDENGQLSPNQLRKLQEWGNIQADHLTTEELKVSQQFPDLKPGAILDIVYLRTRSRWTKALEDRLIREHREGKMVMICDWPNHSDGNYNPFTGDPL